MKTGLQDMPEYIMVTKYKHQNMMLKDCIVALIRCADRDMLGDIIDGKIEDEDKCATHYKNDFKKIMKCLEAFPELKPTIIKPL